MTHCTGRQPMVDGHHPVCRQPVHLDGKCWAHYWTARWPLPPPAMPETPDPDWRDHAACRGMDTEAFYMEKSEAPPPEVIETCANCPVRGDCLAEEMGVAGRQQFGVWGGTGPTARLDLLRRMRRVA